jgi:hypothetical protein
MFATRLDAQYSEGMKTLGIHYLGNAERAEESWCGTT